MPEADPREERETELAPGAAEEVRRFGPYKTLRQLGAGGMGAVYLAVRADDEYRKRVAIKLIKRGMDTEEILRRFRTERQILAGLDHPNIARLLDGGTTEDGLPFFAMEYIEGLRIDEYCCIHKLSVPERLGLFRAVCSAVQYAHQNLVVHRDLKCGNILVTAEGVPKLLDFGIAKLLNPELSAQTALTALGPGMMTPEYASPEQLRGESITTASDVYSLGVLLYELLTGELPCRPTSRAPQEILRALEQEPERPSTRIARDTDDARRLRRQLAGDLDYIVLKALRKEPRHRYASVEQFSEDIERHLQGLPVTARKPTLRYRAGKFVRRRKWALAAAALFLALVLGFAVTARLQSARVARERDKAERISGFLVDLFKVSDPGEARGNAVPVREILEKGAGRISQELRDQPEVQASLMHTMGQAYYGLGLYDRAVPLLEDAVRTRRRILGSERGDLAASLQNLGEALMARGDYGAAERHYREALAIRRKRLGSVHSLTADTLNDLGVLFYRKRGLTTAEPFYREAIAIRRELGQTGSRDMALNLNNLGLLLFEKGDQASAEPLYREALRIYRQRGDATDPQTAYVLSNLGLLLQRRGDYSGAEPFYREALAVRRRVFGEEHPDVAFSQANLGVVLYDRGDYTNAEPLFRRSLELRRKLFPAGHSEVCHSVLVLGRLLAVKGDLQAAEPLLREGLQSCDNSRYRMLTAEARSALGGCLAARGRYQEAEPLLLQGYAELKATRGDNHAATQRALERVARLYDAWGKPQKAAPFRSLSGGKP